MKYALALLLTLLSLTTAHADKIAIAVLDLDAKGEGVSKDVANTLTETVRYHFSKEQTLDLVAREKMFELAKEKAIQLSGCTDVTCAVQVGRALNVKKMIIGSITRLGNKYTIFLQLVDVEKENVECSEKIDAQNKIEELDKYVPGVVGQVIGCVISQSVHGSANLKKEALARFNRTYALALQRKYEDVERELRIAITLHPDYEDAHYCLGLLLEQERRDIESEQEFRTVIGLDSVNADAHRHLGASLSNQQRYLEAESEFRITVRLAPDNVSGYVFLWYAVDSQGRHLEARQYLEKALKVERDPEKIDAVKKYLEGTTGEGK
jgi:tetratricopeptide (TPR) repeat protein